MHKDINPMNIVVNMETKALNIIDFGMASQMHVNEVNIKQKGVNYSFINMNIMRHPKIVYN